jgi:ketosteroid isomerase-like protein
MPEENVEVVRRGFEAWNRQDLEAVRECFSPDLEIDASDRVLNPDVYQGVEGFMRMRREIGDAWEEFRVEAEEFFAAGKDVVAFIRAVGRGRGSGVEVDFRSAWLMTLRDGRVMRARLYRDRTEALEAAGLSD